MVDRDKPGPRVLPRYARLFEPPGAAMGRARREASAAARRCLEAMRFRFSEPEALFLVDLLIHLGEIGAFDLEGSLRKIGSQIGELLGAPPDPSRLYRGMRALAGRTCLVERVSRQIWRLTLAGITDPTSPRHRRLLDETPSPCHLEIAEGAEVRAALPEPENPDDGQVVPLRAQLEGVSAEALQVACDRDGMKVELVAQPERLGGAR